MEIQRQLAALFVPFFVDWKSRFPEWKSNGNVEWKSMDISLRFKRL